MRVFLSAVLIFAAVTGADAQSPRPDSALVVKAGIMEVDVKPKVVTDKMISTGQRVEYREDPHVTNATNEIAIKTEGSTIFGVEVLLDGRPKGRDVKLTVVWLYPEPGIKAPGASSGKMRDSYDAHHKTGEVGSYFWTLNRGYTHVPGIWTVELWQGDRRLLQHQFTMLQ